MLQGAANIFTCSEFVSVCHAGLVFFQMIRLSCYAPASHPRVISCLPKCLSYHAYTLTTLQPRNRRDVLREGGGVRENMEEFLFLFALVEKAVRVADVVCVRNTLSSHSFHVREGPLSTLPWKVYTILLFTGLCSARILFLPPEFSHISSSYNPSSVKLLNRFPSLFIPNAFLSF